MTNWTYKFALVDFWRMIMTMLSVKLDFYRTFVIKHLNGFAFSIKFYWYDRRVVCNQLVTGACIYNSSADNTRGTDLFCSNNFIDRVPVTSNGKVIFRERILEQPSQYKSWLYNARPLLLNTTLLCVLRCLQNTIYVYVRML